MMKTTLVVTASILLTACGSTEVAEQTGIPVTYENYNQAETARNLNSWAELGGNNNLLHLKELSLELNAFAYDAAFVQAMADQFLIDLDDAAEVDEARVAARGFGTRVIQSAARLASPLL